MSDALRIALAEVVEQLADELVPLLAAAVSERFGHSQTEPWRLLNVSEVATLLGRSKRWIHGAVRERGLPVVRLDGGALAFDPEDVRAWARARRVPAADPQPLATRLQVSCDPARNGRSGARHLTAMQKVGGS